MNYGEEIIPSRPWTALGIRPQDLQGLVGIISSPIMHWRCGGSEPMTGSEYLLTEGGI